MIHVRIKRRRKVIAEKIYGDMQFLTDIFFPKMDREQYDDFWINLKMDRDIPEEQREKRIARLKNGDVLVAWYEDAKRGERHGIR